MTARKIDGPSCSTCEHWRGHWTPTGRVKNEWGVCEFPLPPVPAVPAVCREVYWPPLKQVAWPHDGKGCATYQLREGAPL